MPLEGQGLLPYRWYLVLNASATYNWPSRIEMLSKHADVVELVDTLVLGASAVRREGSSPFIRTNLIA